MFLTADMGLPLGPLNYVFGLLMNFIYEMLSKIGIGNIGLAIVIFTLFTRILLYPMTVRQQKSSKMMALIQPEINAIQKKYENKKDQASMMAQQQEMKAVYEKYGTSMTDGCVQLLIQMPIIFSLYRVIMNIPAYVGSIKDHFISIITAMENSGIDYVDTIDQFVSDNKLTSLTTGEIGKFFASPEAYTDPTQRTNLIIDFFNKLNPNQFKELLLKFPAEVQAIVEPNVKFINDANSFLGMNLTTAPSANGFVPNIYWIIPILAFASQYLSAKFMQSATKNRITNEESQMQQTMKTMNIMLPLMSAFFCWGFATGIGVYWIASAIFMTIQQVFVNMQMDKIDIEELIKQNVAKANIKRAKKGLPLISPEKAASNIKNMEQKFEKEEENREKKLEGKEEREEEADKFYFDNENRDSLFAKANMVSKYNEKHNK